MEKSWFWQKSASFGMSVLEAGESTWGEDCVVGIGEHPRGPFNTGFKNGHIYPAHVRKSWFLAKNKCFVWHECSRSRRVHMRWGLCRWNRRTSPGVHLMLNLKICKFIRHTWGNHDFAQKSASFGMSVLEAGESTWGDGYVVGIADHPRGSS